MQAYPHTPSQHIPHSHTLVLLHRRHGRTCHALKPQRTSLIRFGYITVWRTGAVLTACVRIQFKRIIKHIRLFVFCDFQLHSNNNSGNHRTHTCCDNYEENTLTTNASETGRGFYVPLWRKCSYV